MGSCVNTVDDTILIPKWLNSEPWFSHEVGKDFRKRENGGRDDYQWSGNQLDQEEWWIGDFKFPPTQIILLNWY